MAEEVKQIRMTVNFESIMAQAASEVHYFPITMAFQLASASLQKIAKRAVELNDPVLLEELDALGYSVRKENHEQANDGPQ